jgi:hypothetical protein
MVDGITAGAKVGNWQVASVSGRAAMWTDRPLKRTGDASVVRLDPPLHGACVRLVQ